MISITTTTTTRLFKHLVHLHCVWNCDLLSGATKPNTPSMCLKHTWNKFRWKPPQKHKRSFKGKATLWLIAQFNHCCQKPLITCTVDFNFGYFFKIITLVSPGGLLDSFKQEGASSFTEPPHVLKEWFAMIRQELMQMLKWALVWVKMRLEGWRVSVTLKRNKSELMWPVKEKTEQWRAVF